MGFGLTNSYSQQNRPVTCYSNFQVNGFIYDSLNKPIKLPLQLSIYYNDSIYPYISPVTQNWISYEKNGYYMFTFNNECTLNYIIVLKVEINNKWVNISDTSFIYGSSEPNNISPASDTGFNFSMTNIYGRELIRFKTLVVKGTTVSIMGDTTSNGISDVSFKSILSKYRWFDLMGRELNEEPIHGFYIRTDSKGIVKKYFKI